MRKEFDLVINNGTLCTFDPDEISQRNLGIRDGKIVAISGEKLRGRETIDANGQMVVPGFVDFHSHVDGKEFSAGCLARQGATTTIGGERNLDGMTMRQIEENGFLINHGFHISHSFTLRQAVGIEDPYRAATEKEISTMVGLADVFLSQGAFGLHFALELVPGTSGQEIDALAEVAKDHQKVMLFHMRGDGKKSPAAVKEVIRVARETGAPVHIVHLGYMSGLSGIMEQVLDDIEQARKEGCDITADTGMYDAFPSCAGSSILDGDWEEKYKEGTTAGDLMVSSGIYTGTKCTKKMLTFLREEFPNTLIIGFTFEEAAIRTALQKDFVFVSTNAADGPHYEKVGHPETAGTFPRLIGRYVREEGELSLMDALRKITYQPAQRFSMLNKGNLKEGYDADVVIFNYDEIRDRAKFANEGDPNAAPDGISWVIVNGTPVVQKGKLSEAGHAGKLEK